MTGRRVVPILLALAACGGKEEAHPPEELEAVTATIWTDTHEVFVEYPPLIVGRESAFAAHVTSLPSFEPATDGPVTVRLDALQATAAAPTSPGIFRPAITPARPGPCKLGITVGAETVELPACEVFASEADARAAAAKAPPEPPGRITYLKEQAWKTDFASEPARTRPLQAGVTVNGEIKPVAGKDAHLTATTAGRVVLSDPPPVIGTPVAKGQVLATIVARLPEGGDRASLEAEVSAANVELTAARSQLARAERLFAEQAIPEKQVEEARARVAAARARHGGAAGRLAQFAAGAKGIGGGQGGFQIRSPIAGTLVGVEASSGQSVEEGAALFTVIDLDAVWLDCRVFEPDIPKVEHARSAWFTVEGHDQPFVVDETSGKLVTIGSVIDPANRTVPLIFEVGNTDRRLRIGQFARVVIATGPVVDALAVPETAIVDEAGKPVVFVQVEGEAFERRQLEAGIRSRGWVQVLGGLEPGERVVTRGAYDVKLASASGAVPEHGHAH